MNTLCRPVLIAALALAGTAADAQIIDVRVNDLLHQLTIREKIGMLGFVSPGVPRLNIPRYVWWNEGLHGVARAGEATVFPQAIGVAATFDDGLLHQEADVISTEARAKYNLSVAEGRRQQYMGLSFWSPNINIFRDPRWGRGQETYGEDPYLTSRMGIAFVKGIQGPDRNHLKAAACAKHFAVHSGPEATRHSINVQVGEEDLHETYLPAFHQLVDAGVEAVMCAYNRVNDQPCCTGRTLLKDILRDEWGFKGHIVTDCWALDDIWQRHKVLPDRVTVAAEAIKAGVNLDCSDLLQADAEQAVNKGLITEADIDKALIPNLRTAFRLGLYDNPATGPYRSYGIDSVGGAYHRALALKAAEESMVLLKNDGALPLKAADVKTLLVTGSNASSADALLGNYHGISSRLVTFTEGITAAAGPATGVEYDMGCDPRDTVHFGGTWVAGNSDVTVAVIGLTPLVEGEEGDAFLSEGGADKTTLALPPGQVAFIKALRKATRKPIIAVITGGSAMDLSAIAPYVNAIILAWYPGEEGGTALANILFGKVSPSGHLPVTFYRSLADLPAYDDYHMAGRTYRYYNGPVEYPFGFGLSYTTFKYYWAMAPKLRIPVDTIQGWHAEPPPDSNYRPVFTEADTMYFGLYVRNIGHHSGTAVPQVYIEYPEAGDKKMPLKELKQFARVDPLTQQVYFGIRLSALRKWDPTHHTWKLYPGVYRLVIGENAQDEQLSCRFIVK
jgi:beta-glucosidase